MSTARGHSSTWVVLLLVLGTAGLGHADGINTNNALTPASGQLILRAQLRGMRLVAQNPDFDISKRIVPLILAYGLHERLALIAVLPTVARLGYVPNKSGGLRSALRDYGVGDAKVLLKPRIFTRDAPGRTFRVALLAGLEIPSYQAPFSSKSVDVIGGLSVSLKSLDRALDVDATYKANTQAGAADSIFYNAAYSQTLVRAQDLDGALWQLNAVFEVNGETTTGRKSTVYLSPGVQLALPELIIEASVLAPVLRSRAGGPVPASAYVLGFRRFW